MIHFCPSTTYSASIVNAKLTGCPGCPWGPGSPLSPCGPWERKYLVTLNWPSGKLSLNQHRKGAWDRSEGQDSSSGKQKCRITHCWVPGCINSHNCSDAEFFLGFLLATSLQTIPSAFVVLTPTHLPTRFSYGL